MPTPFKVSLAAVSLFAATFSVFGQSQLSLSSLGTATQSGPSSTATPAALAIDGSTGTFSETANSSNSFWEVELGSAYRVTRIEVVPQVNADNAVLRIFDLRD